MSFITELKRRNVFRVGIAYAITGWLIAQIAGLAADSFGAPDWVMKMIITILLLGFPVAMVMAWAYDLTPDGLRRDAGDEATQSANTSRLDRTIIIALVAALAYFAYDKFVIAPQREAALLESSMQQASETLSDGAEKGSEPFSQQITSITPDEVGEKRALTPFQETVQSIAVLPFVNMSDDASNEYFSEGLSEELLNLLVRIPELKVAARTSSFSYKGKDTQIAQIGQELNVAHILEGSVRKSGNQLRITAQLIKADDGFHLWSQTYDRTLDNVFQIQDEIAAAVVNGLKISLLGTVPVARETDPEVYRLYLRGKYLLKVSASNEELEEAVSAFEQALAIDPEYAPAWLGLSWAYEYESGPVWKRTFEETVVLIRETAARALAIDDDMALAWSTSSYIKKKYEWDWQGAEFAANKALQLEPNNVDVLLGTASVAFSLGQLNKAIELLKRAVALDPLRPESHVGLGYRLSLAGRYNEALEKYRQALVLWPENTYVPLNIAETYLRWDKPERALTETNKLPISGKRNSLQARILYTLGREKESRALTSEFLNTPAQDNPFPKAEIYAWRGENDLAFESLELAFDQHHTGFAHFLTSDSFNRLETDPRYRVFLEKLGLLEYWEAMQ